MKLENEGAEKFGTIKIIPPEDWSAGTNNYDEIMNSDIELENPFKQTVI